MPRGDVLFNAEVFKYFLMSEPLINKYLKWMMDEGYIENYVMGIIPNTNLVMKTLNS